MAAIAYITDAKLLEYHRLNQVHEMNFWRLNTNINFSDFKKGDLLFFLSKDKEHQRKKEKGIVGLGRCISMHQASIDTMWKNYGHKNGYTSLKSFKEAIVKVTKDNELPKKISSIYLEDVIFFQDPIYLSDLGKQVSRSMESYIYIDNDDELLSIKLLESAKDDIDIWSSEDYDRLVIEKEEIRTVLYHVHDRYRLHYPSSKILRKMLMEEMQKDTELEYILDSKYEAYKIVDDKLYIVMCPLIMKDDLMVKRVMLGQEALYRKAFDVLYPYNLHIIFKVLEKR